MMSASDLIARMIAGESASEVLESTIPKGAFAMRKYVRHNSPGLAKFLDDRGDLHDFALRLVSGNPSASQLIKQQDIPKQFSHDVVALLAGLEES